MAESDSVESSDLQAHLFVPGLRTIWPDQPTASSIRLVASNIAEGYGKLSRGEYLLFLGHARGSNFELQTQLVIANGLGFGSAPKRREVEGLSEEVSRMLVAIMTKLKKPA